ncbi:MAG: phosphate regulon transcriptional regulatory protein PhoB [Gammaproteobacteria bacterium]|nr:MAG: phosphate regulon transcriptional regulatory protein PhoB [Gammaproteobacteria bacterium]
MQPNILIIDDEQPLREMICYALQQADFQCLQAEDTTQANEVISSNRPDLILLDWMLPQMTGVEFAKKLRQNELYQDIPVIMLTARAGEHDKLRGFESGCDDYITKPFSTRELLARITAVLRRAAPDNGQDVICEGHLCIDVPSHRVMADNQEISLGPTEFRLLKYLMTHHNRVYNRVQLLDRVWGETVYIEERTVDVHIRRLRKALEPLGMDHLIQTVRGSGYRFSVDPKT